MPIVRFHRVPDGEVRVALKISKAQQHLGRGYSSYKDGKPKGLEGIDNVLWQSFCMRMNALDRQTCRKVCPIMIVIMTPFFVCIIAAPIVMGILFPDDGSSMLSERVDMWYSIGAVVLLALTCVIGYYATRGYYEEMKDAVRCATEDMSPQFKERGYNVEYCSDNDSCSPELVYIRFTHCDATALV